jgi:hypothetical protein
MTSSTLFAYTRAHPRSVGPWLFISRSAQEARLTLQESGVPLESVALVAQGIRTGANDIFMVDVESALTEGLVYITNGLGARHLIEAELLRPAIYGSDIRRYQPLSSSRHIVYPYVNNEPLSEHELKSDFPEASRYLNAYRDLLARRPSSQHSGQRWYELVRRRDISWLNKPKLLIRDLATRTSFTIDPLGELYLVGGTAVIPADSNILRPLLGFLNSRLINWYLSAVTPSFRAGFQKYEPQHLLSIPVPTSLRDDSNVQAQLEELVHRIVQSASINDQDECDRIDIEIDSLVETICHVRFSELV